MVRSGQWNAEIAVSRMAQDVLRFLLPPADRVIHLCAETTRKDKRGQKHPLEFVRRDGKHAPCTVGFDMVIMIASWERFCLPVAIAPIDPDTKGHQNKLFGHMLATFELPAWVKEVIVSGGAGFCADETLRLINDNGWIFAFAMARTCKSTVGKTVRDLARHLPNAVTVGRRPIPWRTPP